MLIGAILLVAPDLAADSLLDPVKSELDTALTAIRMERTDFQMRWDTVADDPFRLEIIKELFDDPLQTFDKIHHLAVDIDVLVPHTDSLFSFTAQVLDVEWPSTWHPEMPIHFQMNPDIAEPISMMLREWYGSAYFAREQLHRAFSQVDSTDLDFMMEMSSSVLLNDPDEENKSLAELRQDELEGYQCQERFVHIGSQVMLQSILSAGGHLAKANELLNQIAIQLRDQPLSAIHSINTPLGPIAVGTPGSDRYDGDYLLIVDPGGDDFYITQRTGFEVGNTHVIYDLAGNDTYRGLDFCQGAGVFGCGFLYDQAGNDIYQARNYSQGLAFFGVGRLHDRNGHDLYLGDTAVQAVAAFGPAWLIDESGSDVYQAQSLAQGAGFCKGLAALIDSDGYDRYLSGGAYRDILRNAAHTVTLSQGFGYGLRPYGSGGIGLLFDKSGNDLYAADVFGQGSAYWFALGGLIDLQGDDIYTGYDYCQGSGVHLAFGGLIDVAGMDNYKSWGISQGSGHDLALGGLLEMDGDDNYSCNGLSLGGGNANGLSLFIDTDGQDGYIARTDQTLGYSDRRRTYGMIGVFLDLDQTDFYGAMHGGNDQFWAKSTYGVGWDTDRPDSSDTTTATTPDAGYPEPLASTVTALFLQASAAPSKYLPLVQPARDALIAMGVDSLGYLLTKLRTPSPREYHALSQIIPKIGPEVIPILADSLSADDTRTLSSTIWFMGLVKDSTATPFLLPLLNHEKWGIRVKTAEALGYSGNPDAEERLIAALTDSVVDVRQRAAWALGECGTSQSIESLFHMLDDPHQAVRHSAEKSLENLAQNQLQLLLNHLKNATVRQQPHILRLIGQMGQSNLKQTRPVLTRYLNDPDWFIQAAAIEGLKNLGDPKSRRELEKMNTKSLHPRVRTLLQETLETLSKHRK